MIGGYGLLLQNFLDTSKNNFSGNIEIPKRHSPGGISI